MVVDDCDEKDIGDVDNENGYHEDEEHERMVEE